ncbi:unnamed protein product [Peronospora destructor]|uniref:Uncharacterized protein n=1 Tax=Peronospora destructor TaxID=86335 RepID=A0AAV0UTG9_9STRA|nr:unnamed protein product [Peronospora destructor]
MESGEGGRGKGKKGKKKTVNITHQSGNKGSTNAQVVSIRVKTSTPFTAIEEGPKSTKVSQDQSVLKTKRKRLKKVIGGAHSMLKKQMMVESGSLKTNVQAHDQMIQKSSNAVAIVTSSEMSLKEAMKRKRKRKNVTLKALTDTSDNDRVMTTELLREGTSDDGKKSLLIATQPMKKKRVGKVSTKLLTRRTQKSERVTTILDVSAAMASPCKKAKNEKVEAVRVSDGSTSMLPMDESQVVVKKLKHEVQQLTRGADASKQMDSSMKGTLMLQEAPQAEAAITAEPNDEVTIVLCTNVTKTKQTTANADSGPSTAAFNDKFASSRLAPDASTRDLAIFSKPSHTALAAASLSTVHGKPVFQELMPSGATSPPTDIGKTYPALVASAVSPQLTTARLVTTPIARSKINGGRHKRRRPIDQVFTNSVTDPLQPPTKRSAGSSKDATFRSKANG